MKTLRGFTLIELMIVVAIIAILAAIGYPTYNQYTRKARRAEGINALMMVVNDQEKWFNANNTYVADATPFCAGSLKTRYVPILPGKACPASTASTEVPALKDRWYEITVAIANGGRTFTATATAKSDQAYDREGGVTCTSLTITNTGVKGPASNRDCWP